MMKIMKEEYTWRWFQVDYGFFQLYSWFDLSYSLVYLVNFDLNDFDSN